MLAFVPVEFLPKINLAMQSVASNRISDGTHIFTSMWINCVFLGAALEGWFEVEEDWKV